MDIFKQSFFTITGASPYPWQTALYERFSQRNPPDALDIPTGLGKTSVVLIYLLALASQPLLPRRLVYIVDRRAIVDQTSTLIARWIGRIADVPEAAERLSRLAGLEAHHPVSMGIIRGGLADDGEWRVDPSRPTVLVGTVDMIGSKLLFSGYGDGISRRSTHAGLIGHDAFVFLDEAHLSPAMARVLSDVQHHQREAQDAFRCMTLSATGASATERLSLSEEDLRDPGVTRRLKAPKRLVLHDVPDRSVLLQRMTDKALSFNNASVAIFVRTVSDAAKVAALLRQHLGDDNESRVGLLTGTLRGFERKALADSAVWGRFLPDRRRQEQVVSAFLVMTSAGEVGIDLDADHCVMDATTLDSFIQRVGRVNRKGDGQAEIHLIFTKAEQEGPKEEKSRSSHAMQLSQNA